MKEQQLLAVAREAAAAAATVIKCYYRSELAIEIKGDESPVTIADREAEQAIHAVISRKFPQHAFFGEEYGRSGDSDAEYEWLVDPIDGTKSFVRGYPFFSTQIALRFQGEIIVGVSSAPVFGEEAWAIRGGGAFLNGERIQVSGTGTLQKASVSTGNIASLAANKDGWNRYGSLLQQVNRIRGYGDFYHYHLLARGAIDVVIESDVNILDIAALSLIVEEAGGRLTNLSGGPIDDNARTVLATNGRLHESLLEAIQWSET